MPSRKRAVMAAYALALLALVWWRWPRLAPAAAPAPAPARAMEPAVRQSSLLPPSVPSAAQPSQPASPADEEPAPLIDEIVVEKSEVCEGEENLVTVRAHTVNDTDGYLHYTVGGELGSSVVMRSYLEADGRQPEVVVQAFGRWNAVAGLARPLFRVKDCVAPTTVTIQHYVEPNHDRAFQLVARLGAPRKAKLQGTAKSFPPVRYEWDFGDGTRATTTSPVVVHEFQDVIETTQYVDYLIRVDVHGAEGQLATGRSGLSLLSTSFQNFAYKGVVTLVGRLEPRLPKLDADGKVRQRVRLFHHRPHDVVVDSVIRVRTTSGEPDRSDPLDPLAVLPTRVIPPGTAGVVFELELDANRAAGFTMDRYLIEGRSGDGFRAAGSLSIMKPPARPTPNDEAVRDPQMVARIIEARRLLNQEFVTDGDVARLEREGRFADLQIDPALAEATQRRPRPASTKPHGPSQELFEPETL
jgi:hypothetical protein